MSFLIDLLPGGSDFTDEQLLMMRHLGLPNLKGAAKILDLIIGVPFLIGGLYLISSAPDRPAPDPPSPHKQ